MSVVALMRVTSTEQFGHNTKVNLTPAYVPDESDPHYAEIKSFFDATPQGKFEAVINNEKAAEQFQPGYAFYLSLERAPDKDYTFSKA